MQISAGWRESDTHPAFRAGRQIAELVNPHLGPLPRLIPASLITVAVSRVNTRGVDIPQGQRLARPAPPMPARFLGRTTSLQDVLDDDACSAAHPRRRPACGERGRSPRRSRRR